MMKKKIKMQSALLSLIMTVSLIIGVCAPFTAAAAEPAIRVGYIDYDGFIEKLDNDNFSGYAVRYLNEISKYTGWNYEYVHGDWAELMQQLADGKIDLLCQAQKSAEREKSYLFSKYADGAESSVLYTKADNDKLFYGSYADFSGIRVAMMSGSFQNEEFAEYAGRKGFTFTPAYYDSEQACFEALNNGEVDAVAMGSLAKKSEYKILCRFGSDSFYFITGKQNQELMSRIDDAMEEILGVDPNFSTKLYEEFYGDSSGQGLNLTKEEVEYIKTVGTITVGQLRNRYCISSIDPASGEMVGINEDILGIISDMTGLKFRSVAIAPDTKPVDALKAGAFDMVMGILRTENFLSDTELRVSDSFLESTLTIVMRNGEDFDPKNTYKVALKSSFQAMQEYIAKNYPQYETKYYSDDDACLKAVMNGEVDMMMQNAHTMSYLLQKPQYSSLEMLPTTFLTEQNCMATLSQTDARLISIIDKAISALSDDQINSAILANTTAKPYHLTITDVMYKYRMQIVSFAILVMMCFVLFTGIIVVRKKNEKLLVKKNAQLADAVAQADRANTAKSQFLSRMSHEIRTPMNAIVGLTELARHHEEDASKTDDYLGKIETSSRVLLNIINDVLDMSAIESNKLKIANEKFDIKNILTGITTIYYPQCESKGIKFIMATDLENEMFIGDSLRINQILLNLVSNAYKFTDKGGTIRVSAEETTRKENTVFIRFSVADTGSGMSRDMMERLFKPFEQETAKTAREHGGSGLGLSIAKNLVDMMHGAIKVESEKGKGTVFTVDIPLEISEEACEMNSEALKDINVLVVDDDETSLEYASVVLNRIGVLFDTAASGTLALSMIETAERNGKTYDVVMIDWKMPDMNGIELTRRIRLNEKQNTKIIIVSAYDLNQVEDEAKAAGADHFVSKPLFQSTVFNVLMTLSGGRLHKETAKAQDYDFTGHKVLLSEDNELNSEIATELLNMVHMSVDHAENGQVAVRMFNDAKPGTYDAILMDIQMPLMDGYEATAAIRASGRPDAETIPIFAMTANAFAEDISHALSAGMNDHIAKPIDTKTLYQKLSSVTGNQLRDE